MTSKRRPAAKPGRKAATRIDRRRASVDRRRDQQRRMSQAEHRWRRRQRLRKIGIVALAVVAVAGIAAATLAIVRRGGGSSSSTLTLTSPLVSEQNSLITITAPPATYNLTYKIDTYGDSGQSTSTEDVTVRRPFDGAVYSRDGAPPGGTEQWHALSNFGIYSDTTSNAGSTGGEQSGSTTQVQKAIPQSALGDFRLDATLDDLVNAGTFVRAEARSVLGRNCQVYRTGQPLESFGTTAPTASDYTDACIDEAGLMLEEVSVQSGKLAERIIATQVTTQPTITDSTFAITGTPEPLASGGTELNQIDTSAVPVPGYWLLDAPPAGYQLQGRYVLRHASNPTTDESGTTTTTAAGQAPTIVDSYVDVYVSADKAIIVTQGPATGEPSTQTTGGITGEVGTLGSTTAVASLTGSTLVAHPSNPAGWYVHVSGTVPLATVQQVAQSLHP